MRASYASLSTDVVDVETLPPVVLRKVGELCLAPMFLPPLGVHIPRKIIRIRMDPALATWGSDMIILSIWREGKMMPITPNYNSMADI